jgi:mono/diheme cytochrome c family protein
MNHTRRLASAFLWLGFAALPLLAQTGSTPAAPAGKSGKQNSAAAHDSHLPDGQRVFDQNCSRCHTAPQGFSPNISGTIVRHMRVRASLSKEDEQALLRFLNP